MKELEADEAFYEKTKDFRAQLRVKEMIKSRKESLLAKQKGVGVTEHDPLYVVEQSTEYFKPLNIDKLVKIPNQET